MWIVSNFIVLFLIFLVFIIFVRISNENAKLSNSTYITLDTNKLVAKEDEFEQVGLNQIKNKENRIDKPFPDRNETINNIICCFCDAEFSIEENDSEELCSNCGKSNFSSINS